MPLVSDQLQNESKEIKLSDVTKETYFNRRRSTGFKAGAQNLVRGDHGGFVNIGKKNERLDLCELLKKYDNIAAVRDIYTDEYRDPHKSTVEYSND